MTSARLFVFIYSTVNLPSAIIATKSCNDADVCEVIGDSFTAPSFLISVLR